MSITTTQYVKKPLYVEAVHITRRNFGDVLKWCDGRIQTERADHHEHPGKKYIKIQTHNPINTRQSKAFIGDWILKTERGYKIYSHKAFIESFDEVKELDTTQPSYPHEEGGFMIIGPQCFAAMDESVLNWKGTNYIPQESNTVVTLGGETMEFDEDDSCAIPKVPFDPGVPH